MAKNLIPEELDALIKEYLTDGVLTDKERQVILKKASLYLSWQKNVHTVVRILQFRQVRSYKKY